MRFDLRIPAVVALLFAIACGGAPRHGQRALTCDELCTDLLQRCGTPTNQCHAECADLTSGEIDCLDAARCDDQDACFGINDPPPDCTPIHECKDAHTAYNVTCDGITKTTSCFQNQTCVAGACVTNACSDLGEACTDGSQNCCGDAVCNGDTVDGEFRCCVWVHDACTRD